MNYRIVIFLSLIFCVSCTNIYDKEDLYGTWVCKNGKEEIVLYFDPDLTCELKFINGSNITKITGRFDVDFSKKPVPLSITNIPQINHPLHTIIQFIAFDEIRMAEFSPRWRLRPIVFDRNKEMMFKKQ